MSIFRTDDPATDAAIETALRAAVRAGDDWNADIAEPARRLTEEAGWSWDFTTWRDALAVFLDLAA